MKTLEEIEKLAFEAYPIEMVAIFTKRDLVDKNKERRKIFVEGYIKCQQNNFNKKYTFKELTNEILIENVCLSFRHDFGLMNNEEREKLRFECKDWLRALFNNQQLLKK